MKKYLSILCVLSAALGSCSNDFGFEGDVVDSSGEQFSFSGNECWSNSCNQEEVETQCDPACSASKICQNGECVERNGNDTVDPTNSNGDNEEV